LVGLFFVIQILKEIYWETEAIWSEGHFVLTISQ